MSGDTGGGVNAKLVANGAMVAGDLNPVVFQNMNGDLTSSWGRLHGLNKNSLLEFHWTYLFGGGNVGGSQLNAVVSMNGSSTLPDPTLKVDNVVVDAPAGAGIYFSDAAFTADSTVAAGPEHGRARVLGHARDGTGQHRCIDAGLRVRRISRSSRTKHLRQPDHRRLRVPIHFKTDGRGGRRAGAHLRPERHADPSEAGATLKFGEGQLPDRRWSPFGDLGQAQDKNAALRGPGASALNPVTFTSRGLRRPRPGDWAGLWLRTSNGSQIEHWQSSSMPAATRRSDPSSCGPIDPSINQRARNTAALLRRRWHRSAVRASGRGSFANTTFSQQHRQLRDRLGLVESSGFGPSLNATNDVFGSGPRSCTQNNNLNRRRLRGERGRPVGLSCALNPGEAPSRVRVDDAKRVRVVLELVDDDVRLTRDEQARAWSAWRPYPGLSPAEQPPASPRGRLSVDVGRLRPRR